VLLIEIREGAPMNLTKQGSSQTKSIVKTTCLVFSAIIVFWTGAWIVKISLERSCGWLAWGGGLGVLIALTGIGPSYLQGNPLLPTKMSFSLLNVIIIAPTLEEFLMRGAILGNL
jgi:membrane protease YdiL (CAAX protease family)